MKTKTAINIELIQNNPSLFKQVLTTAICSYIDLEHKLENWVKDTVVNGFPIKEKPCISNQFEYQSDLEKIFLDAIWAYEQHIFINQILNETTQNDILSKLLEMTKRGSIEEVFNYYNTTYFWTEEEKRKHNEECNRIANEFIEEILKEEKENLEIQK